MRPPEDSTDYRNGGLRRAVGLVLAVVALAFLSEPTGRATQRAASENLTALSVFEDATRRVGLDFLHDNGMTGQLYLPEITGPGAGFLDIDNDGDLDLFLVQGGTLGAPAPAGPAMSVGRLYRNELAHGQNGSLTFTDITDRSGIRTAGYGMGVASGDINNDGWADLYVTTFRSNVMFLNNRDGTFSDVTGTTGTDDPRWSTSAAFFDYDRDGWLDLYVVSYVDASLSNYPTCYATNSATDYCGPKAFRPTADRLFRNAGDGTFEDASAAAGILRESGAGLGVVTDDFTGDGRPDIYVANDGDPNQLWVNQGDGTFRNQAWLSGTAVNRDGQAEAGMGVDSGDFSGDGRPDLFLTHLMEETNTLYLNLGDGLFEDRTIEAGLGRQTRRYTGFGTLWFDYDNDGWLDLLSANGSVRTLTDMPRAGGAARLGQPNQLFRNSGRGTFVDTSTAAGAVLQRLDVSRGAAFGDVDNDGDTDVVIANNNGPAQMLLNTVGHRRSWLGLRLVGATTGRDMLGAHVDIVAAGGRVLPRRARTDGGYASAHDPRVLVGLNDAERVDAVRVRWPSGAVEEWRNPEIRRYLTLRQGTSPGGPRRP
jgi:hypothetical protein